jgi:hypothetical protein
MQDLLCFYVPSLVWWFNSSTFPHLNPCGGGVEYLHRDPASRKRRRNGAKKGRAIAYAVSRWLPTAAVRGSRPGLSCGILWWTKWRWGRFSPSTSVSPANFDYTNCSKNHSHLSSGLSTIDHCGSRCKGCKSPPLIHTYAPKYLCPWQMGRYFM